MSGARYSFYTPGGGEQAEAGSGGSGGAAPVPAPAADGGTAAATAPTSTDQIGSIAAASAGAKDEQPQKAAATSNGGSAPAASAAESSGSNATNANADAAEQQEQPPSPSKVVYSFYSSGDLDAVLRQPPAMGESPGKENSQDDDAGGEKAKAREEMVDGEKKEKARGHRPLKPRSDPTPNDDDNGDGHDGDVAQSDGLAGIVDSDDDEEGMEEIYQHDEYQELSEVEDGEEAEPEEEEGESAASILRKLEALELQRKESQEQRQTPRHRNVGVDVVDADANAKQQEQSPPPILANGGTSTSAGGHGVLVDGSDYGAARSLSEVPEAQVEMVGAAPASDVDVSSSAVDIVRDALRLVRQRAAERKQMRRHYEETARHHHQQQVMETPTRPQAQGTATDGGQRQLEPPLEHVGGPNGGGVPPLPPASGRPSALAPVQQASPGQSSLLTPMADVRKMVSISSSDMFRPPVEATPGRTPQRAAEKEARPSLHLAEPVMSTSAMTPGRGPTAIAQQPPIPSPGGPALGSEDADETLERGLEMVLTAILQQSRAGGHSCDGDAAGPSSTLEAVVSSLFGGGMAHLADDRFSRPSRRTSLEIGDGPEHHIQKDESVDDEVVRARDSTASLSSMQVESATSPRTLDLSHLDASASAAGADVSRASSTSTGGGGKHRVLGRLSKSMGGRTGIVLSDDVDADTEEEEDEEQSFGATVDSHSRATDRSDDAESQEMHEDEEQSPKGQDASSPASPSLLRSFSDKIGLTASGSSAKDHSSYDEDDGQDRLAERGASFKGENEEAHALMRILCAHLLPVGLAKSAKKSENADSPLKNLGSWLSKGSTDLDDAEDGSDNDEEGSLASPSWDDEDPDEPGYVVHRLSTAQLQSVEKEFQIMINRVRQTSERRLLEGGGAKTKSGSKSSSQNKDRIAAAQDDDFERDLEEAEDLLDREEQRIEAEQKAAAAASVNGKSASPVLPIKGSIDDDSADTSSDSSNSSSDDDGSSDEESDSTSDSGSDVEESVDMSEWSTPNKEGGDLAKLAGGSPTVPAHLAGNPNFPHVYPSGQGRKGDMELFHLPIIYKAHQTGFEPTKDLVLQPGSVFAGQYLVQNELGTAAFSTAYRCIDLHSGQTDEDGEEYHEEVCLKVIKNTKDFMDQSLDEIKVLELLRRTGQCEQNCIVEMKAFFYHREHLVIVTELLRQNLYEFGKFIMENDEPPYFTRRRLCYITRQSLIALDFIHKLGLIHSDIKPENILLGSYSRAKVKVIDFGSSCYLTDRQSSYIQSRSYRAPEVVLGLPYDGKIDIWSLGCVVAEMFTGLVTFQNDSVVSMLSRIEAICGAFPRHLIAKGRQSGQFFTASGLLYEKTDPDDESHDGSMSSHEEDSYNIFQPKTTTMAARLGFEPDLLEKTDLLPEEEECAMFVDFVRQLLTIDPDARPTAEEALRHPWILSSYQLTEEDIKYPPEDASDDEYDDDEDD